MLNSEDRWLTLALNNSIFPSWCVKSFWSCNVFFNRSEIDGKKEPIISEAWILLICFPNETSLVIGISMNLIKTKVFNPINPKNKNATRCGGNGIERIPDCHFITCACARIVRAYLTSSRAFWQFSQLHQLHHTTQLAYGDSGKFAPYADGGHDVAGDGSIFVPTQGFNVFAAVTANGKEKRPSDGWAKL